jgi:hypothetical protein
LTFWCFGSGSGPDLGLFFPRGGSRGGSGRSFSFEILGGSGPDPGGWFWFVLFSGRNYRYHFGHRYRTNGSCTVCFRFCAVQVVPAQVFAGRRPAKICAGTTGIAQNAGPISSIPVAEVISVGISATELLDLSAVRRSCLPVSLERGRMSLATSHPTSRVEIRVVRGRSPSHIYSMLRNSASGPEVGFQGRILVSLLQRKH